MEQQLNEDDSSASLRAENKETSTVCESSANDIDNGTNCVPIQQFMKVLAIYFYFRNRHLPRLSM